jgi:hypothetical protein
MNILIWFYLTWVIADDSIARNYSLMSIRANKAMNDMLQDAPLVWVYNCFGVIIRL